MEIIPSARTGRVAVRSDSFQTEMNRVSSGPITYEGTTGDTGCLELSAVGAFEFCAQADRPLITNKSTAPTAIERFIFSPRSDRDYVAPHYRYPICLNLYSEAL